MKASYPSVELGELCHISSGGTPSRTNSSYWGGGIPWVKISDMLQGRITFTEETISEEGYRNSSARLFPKGTLLMSIFATIGRTAVLDIEATTNQAIVGIQLKNGEVDLEYLRHYLNHQAQTLAAKARGVAQLNINSSILRSLKIPLPPLEEQKRIARILDKADELQEKRRQAIAKLDELLQSVFLDMFGDPVTNPKGWPVVKLGELLEENPSLGTTRPATGLGQLLVRVGELGESTIRLGKCGRVDLLETELGRYLLRPGDIVLARAIGSKAQLGKASIFFGHVEPVVFDSHVMRIRLPPARCCSTWFYTLIRTTNGKRLLQSLGGATSVQFNINASQVKGLSIPLPPLLLQQQFDEFYHGLSLDRELMLESDSDHKELSLTLLKRVFKDYL